MVFTFLICKWDGRSGRWWMRCTCVEDLSVVSLTEVQKEEKRGHLCQEGREAILSREGGRCQEWGGELSRAPVFADLSLLVLALLPFTSSSWFLLPLLCLLTPVSPFRLTFRPWRVFNGHLLTCVLGQGMSPCRSRVLMEVFLPKTHTLSPACVSWFTKMDILDRNDDSKLKTGYKCDVSIIGGQGREVVGYTTESRGPAAGEGWGCWQRGGCELSGPSKDAQIQQSSRHFGPNTSESIVHFLP